MTKKALFYLFLLIIIVVFQVYVRPEFFILGFLILLWVSWEAREVYVFLIAPLLVDLASNLPFGFFVFLSWAYFFLTLWVQKNLFRSWSFWAKSFWFLIGESIYLLFYLEVSQTFSFGILIKNISVAFLFAIILLALAERLRGWLESAGMIARTKKIQIEM